MDKEKIEILNTGILRSEFVKNVTHFFCGAVLHECERINTEIGAAAGY